MWGQGATENTFEEPGLPNLLDWPQGAVLGSHRAQGPGGPWGHPWGCPQGQKGRNEPQPWLV